MSSDFDRFVFRGLMAARSISGLQTNGLLRSRESAPMERTEIDLFAQVPEKIRSGSIAMRRAFRLLYIFENCIREFIDTRFTDLSGPGWFSTRATKAMKDKVEQRKQSEQKNLWHAGRHTDDIFYLDFGDLGLLMVNHWNDFKHLFPDQAWINSRIQEAERSRNVIAHTNLLADDEIARLEMYFRDWMAQTT